MGIFDFFKKTNVEIISNSNPNSYYQFDTLCKVKILNWYHTVVRISYKNEDFPGWMKYECGINEPLKKQKELLKAGFLKQCNFEETLRKLTISQLKEIIHSQNLPNARKKADLINIICEKANHSLISLPIAYTTSEKGNTFLEENKELLIADSYRIYDVSIEEYFNETKLFSEDYNSLDVVKSILNKRIAIYSKQKNFGLLRNVYLHLAQIAERNNDFSKAMKNYIIVQYYDMTGLGNNDTFSKDNITLAPAIIKAISQYKNYYDKKMITTCKDLYAPKTLTAFEEFEKIINKIVNDKPLPKKYTK